MEADAAGVLDQAFQHLRIPFAFVAGELARCRMPFDAGAVGQQHGFAGLLVPLAEVLHGVFEILEGQHVHEGQRGIDDLHGDGWLAS